MKVLYQLTIPRPAMPRCEAVWQEIDLLRRTLGGDLLYLNPSRHPVVRLPRVLYGFHRLVELRRREAAGGVDLYHLYNPDPYPFPILKWLRRPIVYSVSAALQAERRPRVAFFAKRVHTLVVASETDLRIAVSWGLTNSRVVRPGIDASRFSPSPVQWPQGQAPHHTNAREIRLMVGSAPWVESQFRKKGIDTLLDVAADLPQLRLAFLWRGVLFEEMSRRVRQRGLEARVDVLNREVDVNRVLGGVHASIALAEDPTIIKAFPHSLMESLAAGKPVLISRGIPLAEVVERTGCGQVVDRITPRAIADALYKLGQDYDASCQSALRVGRSHFSHDRMVADYVDVYRNALDGG